MIRKALPFAAAALLSAAPAAAWLADNGLRVEGTLDAITVHSMAGPSSAPSQIICAAALYAEERLGALPSHRVVVTAPRQRGLTGRGGQSVGFRVSADAPINHGILLSVSEPGITVSIAHAKLVCDGERGPRT